MITYDPAGYGETWALDYDKLYQDRDNLDSVADFLVPLTGQRSVLEFGIGTGRLALPLAARGLQVHGIDSSEAMLERLRAKPGADRLQLHLGSFTDLQVEGEFGLVLIAFSTIFLVPDQEAQIACLANAAKHLAPDGVMVVEAFVPDHSRWTRHQNITVSEVRQDMVDLSVARHDPVQQRIVMQHVLLGSDGLQMRPNELRYAWPSELDLMARLAGLRLQERVAGWRREPFTADSGNHVSVYRRS